MNKLSLYYNTLKDLKLIQINYRFIYILKRKLFEKIGQYVYQHYEKKYNSSPKIHTVDHKFILNDRNYYFYDLDKVLENKITFLNHEIDFGESIQWDTEELNRGTRLWKLNLHYHDFLVDIAWAYQRSNNSKYLEYIEITLKSWIHNNPIGTKDYGKDNWNSYCISLRIIAWIKIYTLLHTIMKEELKIIFLKSLWIQGEFLYDNLELDILGNHLIKNYKALQWFGIFFNSDKHTKKASSIFDKYIQCQFTKDGMHEELSPMYSGIILEDLIEVYILTSDSHLLSLITKQYNCLQYLVGMDEKYTFFNDSVNRNGIEFIQVKNLYHKIISTVDNTIESTFTFDGYIGFENKNEKFIFDAGNIVEGHQAGHGHCDALSFEYYRYNQKIFTNSGVYEYNSGARRTYARSTKAHNTLEFNQQEQSQIWGSFRTAKRAKVGFKLNSISCDSLSLEAFVSGFDFKNTITHRRNIDKQGNNFIFSDIVEADNQKESKIFFHLMPPFYFSFEQSGLKIMKDEKEIASVKTNFEGEIIKTSLYEEFGLETQKSTLCFSKIAVNCNIKTTFQFLD